ncbi:GAF domain-containing protein [Cryobacterium sp. PH31-AA6]|uniref:GAF domain-containing protein n=1 Tax=Cryobacterium sp. PH31-AA6 TaxID=3046205 RepID=UPI0024BAE8B1|nr:GAF domain-containing protein [Cryobacterium sp. PH31-AA6]MDJ0325080.1 GAF domain-containing protein [Cryobacterium sp. PH31-AA6]
MPSPWTVGPTSDPRPDLFLKLEQAHEAALTDRIVQNGVRRLVQESWDRSLSLRLDPSKLAPESELSAEELRELRDRHPLAAVLPVVHNLLIRHAFAAGLIVAIGDEHGRVLWIDGDRVVRRKAEGMHFVEGSDWSERRVGTSAPGTALALDHGIQIQRAEHFSQLAHPWSCTAVPIHDPDTGTILGVIDITGGADAVAPQTLPLVEAAVAAMETELRIQRLSRRPPGRTTVDGPLPAPTLTRPPAAPPRALPTRLDVLGRDHGRLDTGEVTTVISPRHAEILTLLAWNRDGLSADRLALLLSDQSGSVDNLRAEMVRLRRVLEQAAPRLGIASRPYRFESAVDLDALRVLALLERGAHRVALAAYRGPVLPSSTAPGIDAIRAEVSARLREAMLSDASAELLLEYARTDEASYDSEVWRACLELLPARSPKRASVVAGLKRIAAELEAPAAVESARNPPQR